MEQLRTDQKSRVFEDTAVAELVGECDSLFHGGEIFGWGRVDGGKQFECRYGAEWPVVPGTVIEQCTPVALRNLAALTSARTFVSRIGIRFTQVWCPRDWMLWVAKRDGLERPSVHRINSARGEGGRSTRRGTRDR